MGLSAGLGNAGLRPGVCTSTSRPSSPFKGQVIYETDTDLTLIYNGATWRSTSDVTASTNGSILQIVYGSYSTTASTASSSAQNTGLSATITPSSTSSKVLVIVNQAGLLKQSSDTAILLSLYRGTTNIGGNFARACFTENTGSASGSAGVSYLDSPNTTSAITYKTMFLSTSATGTVYVQWDSMLSTMTLMEVSA